MGELKLKNIDLEGICKSLDQFTGDEPVILMENRFKPASPERFSYDVEDVFPDHFKDIEHSAVCPLFQDQYRTVWPMFFKQMPEDIEVGCVYVETGHIDDHTIQGVSYEKLRISIDASIKLAGNRQIPKDRSVEFLVIDYHDKDHPRTVSRKDHKKGIFSRKDAKVSEISTEIIISGYVPKKEEYNIDKKVPYGLDCWEEMHGDAPKKRMYESPEEFIAPVNPCYDECSGLAAVIWWGYNKLRSIGQKD